MKKIRFLMNSVCCLLILIVIPLVMTHLFHIDLKPPPGWKSAIENSMVESPAIIEHVEPTETPQVAELVQIECAYGFYPDDRWAEGKCGVYLNAPETGEFVLKVYYPFEITGEQKGQVFVDGQWYCDFTVIADNFDIRIPCEADKRHFIQINSDFAKLPNEKDHRSLAFVLLGVEWESGEETVEHSLSHVLTEFWFFATVNDDTCLRILKIKNVDPLSSSVLCTGYRKTEACQKNRSG